MASNNEATLSLYLLSGGRPYGAFLTVKFDEHYSLEHSSQLNQLEPKLGDVICAATALDLNLDEVAQLAIIRSLREYQNIKEISILFNNVLHTVQGSPETIPQPPPPAVSSSSLFSDNLIFWVRLQTQMNVFIQAKKCSIPSTFFEDLRDDTQFGSRHPNLVSIACILQSPAVCWHLSPHVNSDGILDRKEVDVLLFFRLAVHGYKFLSNLNLCSIDEIDNFLKSAIDHLLRHRAAEIRRCISTLFGDYARSFVYLAVTYEGQQYVLERQNDRCWQSDDRKVRIAWRNNWSLFLNDQAKATKVVSLDECIPSLSCLQGRANWTGDVCVAISTKDMYLSTVTSSVVATLRNSQATVNPKSAKVTTNDACHVSRVTFICQTNVSGGAPTDMRRKISVPSEFFGSTLFFMGWDPVLRVLDNPECYEKSELESMLFRCLWMWANRNDEHDACMEFYKSALCSLEKYQGRACAPQTTEQWKSRYVNFGCIETPRLFTVKERIMLMIACSWPVYFWDNIDQKNGDTLLRIRGMAMMHIRFAKFMRQRMLDFGFIDDDGFPPEFADYSTVNICSNVCRNGLTKWDWHDKFVFDLNMKPMFLRLKGCSKAFNADGIYAATTCQYGNMRVYAFANVQTGNSICQQFSFSLEEFSFTESHLVHPTVILIDFSAGLVLHCVKFAFALNSNECIIKRASNGQYSQFFSVSHRIEEFIYQSITAPTITEVRVRSPENSVVSATPFEFEFGVHIEAVLVPFEEVQGTQTFGFLTDQATHFDGNTKPHSWHGSRDIQIGESTIEMFGVCPAKQLGVRSSFESLDLFRVSRSCMFGVFHDTKIGIIVGRRRVHLSISDGCGFMFSFWFKHFGIGSLLWHWRPHSYYHSSDIRHFPVSTPEGLFVLFAAAKLLKNCNDPLTHGGFERLILETLETQKYTLGTDSPVSFSDMSGAVVLSAIADVYTMVFDEVQVAGNGAVSASENLDLRIDLDTPDLASKPACPGEQKTAVERNDQAIAFAPAVRHVFDGAEVIDLGEDKHPKTAVEESAAVFPEVFELGSDPEDLASVASAAVVGDSNPEVTSQITTFHNKDQQNTGSTLDEPRQLSISFGSAAVSPAGILTPNANDLSDAFRTRSAKKSKEAAAAIGAAQDNLLQQSRETAYVLSTTVDSDQFGIPSASRLNAQPPPSHLPFVQLPNINQSAGGFHVEELVDRRSQLAVLEAVNADHAQSPPSHLPFVQLRNISQSCWLNASLQCLLHTTELSLLFLDAKFDASSLQEANVKLRLPNWPKIAEIFKGIVISSNSGATVDDFLLQQLKTEVDQIIDARDKVGNPDDSINPGRQKDSSEGLGVLVEAICPVMFGLRFISAIVCHGCSQESSRADPTNFLSLPFIQPSRKGKCVSLDECIKSYFSPETLSLENQYECSSCLSRTAKKKQDASKKLFLDNTALPNFFFVDLKRYETSPDGLTNKRINRKIDVPLEYDFGQHCVIKGTQPFRLYAVVCHRPGSGGLGHYYAYCQPKSDMQWTNLDDQQPITNSDYSDICDDIRSNGYIFFFSRTPAALNAAGADIDITSDNMDIGDEGKGDSKSKGLSTSGNEGLVVPEVVAEAAAEAKAAAKAKDAAKALLETQLSLSGIDRQSLVGKFICAHATSFRLAVVLQQIVHRVSWYHQDLMGEIDRIHDDMRQQVDADDDIKEIMFEAEEKNVYNVGELIFAVIRDCDTCKKTTIATATPVKAAASPANPMLICPVDELVFKAPRHFCFDFRDLQTRASQLVSKQNEAVGKSSISSALKQYNDRVYDIKHTPCYVYPEAYSSLDVRSNSSSSLSPCIAHPDEFINGGTVKWFFTALATLFPGAMLLPPGLFTYNCDQNIGQRISLANWKGNFIKRRPYAVLHPVNLPKSTDQPLVTLGFAGDPPHHWILFVFELGWTDHSLSNVKSHIMDPYNSPVTHLNARIWCNDVEAALDFSLPNVTLDRTPFDRFFPKLQRGDGNAHCAVFSMALGLNYLTKTLNQIEKHLVTDTKDTSLIGVELRKMVAWDCNHEPAMLNACFAMSPAFCNSNYLSQPPSASHWWRVTFTHDIVAALSLQPEFEKGGLFSLYGVKDGKLKRNFRYDPDFPERFAKVPSDGPFFLQNESFFVKVYCIGLLEKQDYKDKRSSQRAASAFIDASATTLACESNGWWVAAFGLICIGLTTPCAFVCVGRNILSTISKDTCCIELGDLFQNLAFEHSVLQGDYYCSNVVSDVSGNKQAIDFERASMLKGKSPPRLFFQYYARSVASNNASSIQILMLQMRASGMEETQSYFSSIYRRNKFLEATFDADAFSKSPRTVFLFHGFWNLMELLYVEATDHRDPIPELAIIDSKMCISCHIRPFSWYLDNVVVRCNIFFEHLKDNSITISSALFDHQDSGITANLQAAFSKRQQYFNFKGDEDASKIFKFALSMESLYGSTGSEGSNDAWSSPLSPPPSPRPPPPVKRLRDEGCRSERDIALDRQFNFLYRKGTTTNVWNNCKLSVQSRFPDYELRPPSKKLLQSSRPNNQLEPSHFGSKVFTVSGSDVTAQSSCIDFISSQNVLCIDTETVYPRFPEQNHGISLLQIGTSAQVFLIQVKLVGDDFLVSLKSALGGKNKTLVHWGGSDKVDVLKVLGDITLVNWTDLQYAMSPKKGLGILLGLDACMTMHLNGIYTVSKEWTLSGWDLVDLDLCQRDYAALDVVSCYVLYLRHVFGLCFLQVTEDDLSPSVLKFHSFFTQKDSAIVRDGLSFDNDRCCHYELGTLVQGLFFTKNSSGNGMNVVLPQGFKKTSWTESGCSNIVDVFLDMLNSQKFCCRICFNLKWFQKINFVCPQFRIVPGDLSQFSFQRGRPIFTHRVTTPVPSSESTIVKLEAFFCLSMLGVFLKIQLRSSIDYACLVDSVRSDCRHGFICSTLSFFQE